MEAEEAEVVGFEEGMSWLPAQVLHEACGTLYSNEEVGYRARHYQNQHPTYLSGDPLPPPQYSKGSRKFNQRPRYQSNWASRGQGMQAIFLDSGNKSCGTGVFLPRRAGSDLHPSKKPSCSPVLLPSRVVQALNLNVQALGLQISPRQQDSKNIQKTGVASSANNQEDENIRNRCNIMSDEKGASPEIFLPKEWSY